MHAIVERYARMTPGSAGLHQRSKRSLPGGDTRTVTAYEPHPLYIEAAGGIRLEDVDANTYLDLLGNYTSMIHGHAHPEIVRAISEQAARGTGHAAASLAALELAEELCSRVESVDTIRFCNSGTEATLNALRAARAFTARNRILRFEGGYHGSHDLAEISVAPDPGRAGPAQAPVPVPEEPGISEAVVAEVVVAPFNDLDATAAIAAAHAGELAAIIVEPMLGAAGSIPPAPGFLSGLRGLADSHGAILVFDEVITLRMGTGGGQGLYGVRPDLTTFGKIIGGGLPVGAFGGRREIMEMYAPPDPTMVQSGTFNANPLTMAAGLAAMHLLDHAALDEINRLGNRLADGIEKALVDAGVRAQVTGHGSLQTLHWTAAPVTDYRSKARSSPAIQPLFHLGLLTRGVFTAPRGMFAVATPTTDEDIDTVVTAVADTVDELKPVIAEEAPDLLA